MLSTLNMAAEWYKDWFDTNYYHLLYDGRDMAEAEDFLDRLAEHLKIPANSRIVDIGCGRGRHSIYLNKLGFDVTGIDLAGKSIDEARKFENEGLHFYRHDNRNVFKEAYFDYAFNLFTSFGYLETRKDLLKQLIRMRDNLKVSGIFVLDYFNSETVKECDFVKQHLIKNDISFEIEKRVEGHQVIKTIEVEDAGKSSAFQEVVHLITEKEFRELFSDAGLEILHTFGNYRLEEFNPDVSERLIITSRRIT